MRPNGGLHLGDAGRLELPRPCAALHFFRHPFLVFPSVFSSVPVWGRLIHIFTLMIFPLEGIGCGCVFLGHVLVLLGMVAFFRGGFELLFVRPNGGGAFGRRWSFGTATTMCGSSFFQAPLLGFPIGVLITPGNPATTGVTSGSLSSSSPIQA